MGQKTNFPWGDAVTVGDDPVELRRHVCVKCGWEWYEACNKSDYPSYCPGCGEPYNLNEDIITETANEIVEILSTRGFDDVTDSSGYYVIKEIDDGTERVVDVYKSTADGVEEPHYVIYVGYEDENFDYRYTKDLSAEALVSELKKIAEE